MVNRIRLIAVGRRKIEIRGRKEVFFVHYMAEADRQETILNENCIFGVQLGKQSTEMVISPVTIKW